MTDKSNLTWYRDPGYSFEETARRGDFAAVICPPDFTDDGSWAYQIFDEADEDAMAHGRTTAEAYQIRSRDAAKRLAGILLAELDGARA